MSDDLNTAIDVHHRAAKRNFYATFFCALLGTGASVLASILAFLQVSGVIVGVLALVPAMAAVLVSRLKLQDRANWYYLKHDRLLTLYNQLHFELPDPPTSAAIADISKRWSALNEDMAGAWETRLAISMQDMQKNENEPKRQS